MRQYWRGISAAATALIVAGPSLWLSPAFENCIKAIPDSTTYQHQANGLPFFLFFGSRWFGCLGPFVDINSAAIVAVFTVVLTISTAMLWIDTRRLAVGGEIQAGIAKRALESDRAWITWDSLSWGPIIKTNWIDEFINDGFAVSAVWKNSGRSPARNISAVNLIRFIDRGDPIPTFIVAADTKTTQQTNRGVGDPISGYIIPINDVDAAAFRSGAKRLIFYSRVTYMDVFDLSNVHVSEACVEVVLPGGKMMIGDVQQHAAHTVVGPQNRVT